MKGQNYQKILDNKTGGLIQLRETNYKAMEIKTMW